MTSEPTAEPTLRERKKATTRAALSRAAWSLMLRQGLDAVTPESVAAAVDVSSRTFRNYFASVEEAILDELVQRYLTLADKIRARPAGEPVWDCLLHVLPSAVPEIVGDRADFVVLLQAVSESPAMLAQNLVMFDRGADRIAEVIAERTGTDSTRDAAARLLAGAATSALRASIQLWTKGATDVPLPDLIRDCLGQLRAGVPVGAAVSTA